MRIKELAATPVLYGYRRLHILLRREGWTINHKRTHRLYREMGLQLRNTTPKRRVKAKLRDDRMPAMAPNDCWSMDFLSDQLFDGRKIRILSIIDNFSRLCQRSTFGRAMVVPMSWKPSRASSAFMDAPNAFVWIMVQNLSRRTSTYGPGPIA